MSKTMTPFTITEHDLKPVALKDLKNLCAEFELVDYGTKHAIAQRIHEKTNGKKTFMLTKLISKAAKVAEKKKKSDDKKSLTPKAKFFKDERERLVKAGLTDKKKITAEVKHLWDQQNGKGEKKSAEKKKKTPTIITSNKIIDAEECKRRKLRLVGTDASSGKTIYHYMLFAPEVKPLTTITPGEEEEDDDDDEEEEEEDDDDDDDDDEDEDEDDDDDVDMISNEARDAMAERMHDKKPNRELILKLLITYGVKANTPEYKTMPLKQLYKELIDQMTQESDSDDDSDGEE